MKNQHWKRMIAGTAIAAMTGMLLLGNAEAAECRIDWNGDYQITMDDYLGPDGQSGFYFDFYICMYTQYAPIFGIDCNDVDYNEDGTVDLGDLMGTLEVAAETEGYYTEWYIFSYTQYYPVFFPEYDVCPPQPLPSCLGWELIDVGGPDAPGLPWFFEELDGKLYFAAANPVAGTELMVYDPATKAVTVASDINPGPGNSGVRDLTAHQGKLYFQANDYIGGYDAELFVFDPATGVSTKIDLNATSSSLPTDFYSASNGLLYFRARDEIDDQELWEYNPITGQHTIYEIYPGMAQFGPNRGTPKEMLEYDGIIYMAATGAFGQEFYSFDMVTKEIQLIADIAPAQPPTWAQLNSYPQNLAVFNGEIFFNANINGIQDAELWIYNPVSGNLRELVINDGQDMEPGGSFTPSGGAPNYLTEWGGKLYMSAQQVEVGNELFVYDPVTDGVTLAWDSAPGTHEYCNTCGPMDNRYPCPPCIDQGNNGNTGELTLLNDKFYFSAPFDNRELWEWDPATGQGQQIIELFPGVDQFGLVNHGHPTHMVAFDDKLVFRGNTETALNELIIVSWAPENCP